MDLQLKIEIVRTSPCMKRESVEKVTGSRVIEGVMEKLQICNCRCAHITFKRGKEQVVK